MDRLEEIRQHCEGGGRGCDGKGGKRLKLGSLFDGSGGFPLSGVLNGIEPVWAAEVEPYPIAVTRSRFPHMKHYGDVSKMRGAELEPVDIITFGSPCQDMSIAGKREGLKHEAQGDEETTRSGLFYEAIRIVKEMREATNGEYPKYAVWENVPGAFSSNKGRDFHAVLEALCSVCDSAVSIPKPYDAKRTKLVWNKAGEIVGDNYSIAWRTLDAQYWGVPQRRKRIYLVADFTGGCAGEILFKQDGLPWNHAESRKAGQGSTADAVGGVDGSVGVFNESGIGYWMPGYGCLRAEGENRPSRPTHTIVQSAGFCQGASPAAQTIGYQEEIAPTVKGAPSGTAQVPAVVVVQDGGETARTLTARYDSSPCADRGQNIAIIAFAQNQADTVDRHAVAFQLSGDRSNPSVSVSEDKSYCVPANPMSDRGQAVCYENHQHGGYREGCGTLRASGGDYGGGERELGVLRRKRKR